MKKPRTPKSSKRPPRVILTREEVLKRMKEFPKRKARLLAIARTGKKTT